MIRTMLRNVALLAALGLGFAASNAQAGFSGTLAVGGINSSSDTGNILTATSFTIPTLFTESTGTGNFSNIAGGTFLTGGTFTIGNSTEFSFTSSYGTFTETDAPVMQSSGTSNGTSSIAFYILGAYSGDGITAGTPASFTVSFTETGGTTSSSGTLAIPPAGAVPEPASVAMLGLGLVAMGGYGLRRRMAKSAE